MNLLVKAHKYIIEHNLDTSPEAMFIEFEFILECHKEFDVYLKEKSLNQSLEKMKRNKRLLQKRKLFINWFIERFQNEKMIKEIHIDLSEMVFASERTVREDIISTETTA